MQVCGNYEQAPVSSSLRWIGQADLPAGYLSSRAFRNWYWELPRSGSQWGAVPVLSCQGECTVKSDLPPPQSIPVPRSNSYTCTVSHPLTCCFYPGTVSLLKLSFIFSMLWLSITDCKSENTNAGLFKYPSSLVSGEHLIPLLLQL